MSAMKPATHQAPAVSQRVVEALGGRLTVRQGRHELAFLVSLPPAMA